MLDLKIAGGLVLDGSGAPAFAADVGVCGDTITAVGDLSQAEARRTFDLGAQSDTPAYVCPGFIDAHSHSDAYLLMEPSSPSKIHQGVTTEVVGNCGVSVAPRMGQYQLPSDWREQGYPGTWSTVAEYRELLEQARPAPNTVQLIGHGTVRAGVIGYENRPATTDEMAEMTRCLEQALDEGGRGLSTGLIYPPGIFAPHEELVELTRVAARRGGLYASHMRDESVRLIEAIEETLTIGRCADARVQISHLKAGRRVAWGLAETALEVIDKARDEGVDVSADRYPYTSSWTSLDTIFPDWALEGGNECITARLRDSGTRRRLRDALLTKISADDWTCISLAATAHPDTQRFQGMLLTDVATELGVEPVDAALDVLDMDEVKTMAFFHCMNEENMFRFLSQPYVMIGSDASLRGMIGPLSSDYPHPRTFGTFPRFLRMALDGRTVSLEEAVRKMTSLAADQFGLTDRGRIAEGRKADLVVIDMATVRDGATFKAPRTLPDGIQHVIVNGTITLEDGQLTGERAGRVL